MSCSMWQVLVMTPTGSLPKTSRIPPILPPLRHRTATHLPPPLVLPMPMRWHCVGSFRNSGDSNWAVADSIAFSSTDVDASAKFFIHEASVTEKMRETSDDGVIAKKGIELVGTNVVSGEELPAAAQNVPDALTFVFWSILLVVVFWLGNYVAPDLIFRNTVFRRQSVDKPDATESSKEEF